MPPVPASKQFEIITGALALAEERESVSLTEAAAILGVTRDQLIALLTPVVYLEFRDSMGEVIAQVDAFDLDPEADMLHVRAGHWLRDWDASAPPGDAAVRLFVTATFYQATGAASSTLDAAVTKLRQLVAIDMVIPTRRPPGLRIVEEAYGQSRSLKFGYTKNADDVTTERHTLPYDLYGEWGRWYAPGPEVGDDVVKYWRVDSMSDVTLGPITFDPPDELPARGLFDLSGITRRLTVIVPDHRRAALPQPHTVRTATPAGDGRVRLEIEIAGDRHLDHFLVALGPDGEVVEPAEYRQRRSDRAAVLLAHLDQA